MRSAPPVTAPPAEEPVSRTSITPIPRRGTVERRNYPLAREVARLLNYYRRRKRLTLTELADQSGIAERDIRRFERATHAPDITELFRLAPVYGVEVWKIARRIEAIAVQLAKIDAPDEDES